MDYRDEGTYFSVDLNTADYNRLTPYFISESNSSIGRGI